MLFNERSHSTGGRSSQSCVSRICTVGVFRSMFRHSTDRSSRMTNLEGDSRHGSRPRDGRYPRNPPSRETSLDVCLAFVLHCSALENMAQGQDVASARGHRRNLGISLQEGSARNMYFPALVSWTGSQREPCFVTTLHCKDLIAYPPGFLYRG